MLHFLSPARLRPGAWPALLMAALLVAGCAGPQPESTGTPASRETSLSDAQRQAQGRKGIRAPSQLQLGFGEAPAPAAAEQPERSTEQPAREVRELLQARTFLGTVPCVTDDAGCPASRIVLTLAPTGEWRARTTLLGAAASSKPIIQNGCWDVTGRDPLRIMLRTMDGQTRAGFVFVNDNLLRVTQYNDIRPALDYHLTRQPDIDPIDELADSPALICN